MKNAVGPRVIVEVEKKYNDQVEIPGLILQFDPMYKPTEHLNYSGIIKAVPEEGFIPWADYNRKKEIDPILKVGDKIYFRYIATDNEALVLEKSLSDTSEKITFSVHYSWVFCVVRNNEIIPIGGWCLGEPIIEGGGNEEVIDGHKVRVEYHGDTQIIKSIHTKKSKEKAIVRYVSTFLNEDSDISVGDTVWSGEGSGLNFENKIEGKEFYCFREDIVKAVI